MRPQISTHKLLQALSRLEDPAGSSLDHIAWELDVEPDRILTALANGVCRGLVVGNAPFTVNGEARWRLTPGGWAELSDRVPPR